MFESIINIFKKNKKQETLKASSKNTAKERLHLVLMQDRANVSADFLDLMRKEIIEVIKKYIDIDEKAIDVRLETKTNEDGSQGAPALYANIPIINIKDETRSKSKTNQEFKIIDQKSNRENETNTENSKKIEDSKIVENNKEEKDELQNLEETKKQIESKIEQNTENIEENTEEKDNAQNDESEKNKKDNNENSDEE